jgi:N-acetylglucosaminyldiphosphoundecaprenol N-acetyl-beta-D-mannosaminyltransferase
VSPAAAGAPLRPYYVCGVQVSPLSPSAAADEITQRAKNNVVTEVHLCNAFTLSLVDGDARLRHALGTAHLNFPDGAPVAWMGRRHGVVGPVRGPQLVRDVARLSAPHGIAHYFFGGAPGIAQQLADVLIHDYPGICVVGVESPPFGDQSVNELRAAGLRMADAGAAIVWVGLGTPRQDYVVPHLAQHSRAVVVPVGAAFDFLTSRVAEAPAFLHGTGLEWIHRLSHEPRRLWRRYLLGNPRFLRSAIAHSVRPDASARQG